ncbi:MAG: hypothetical protein Q8O47_01850 [Candidatus Bathyarchaeota archaeon]|nr:hypothetical protein [Candidatus Bathyarchaeota archaeon]
MLGRLFKRALYRELRSAVGYYDARRIVRFIEASVVEATQLDGLGEALREAGFEERHVEATMKIAEELPFPIKEGS